MKSESIFSPMDRIYIRDLRLACTIGVNDWEREILQTVQIDLDLEMDLAAAGKRDDLNLTADYKALRDRIETIVAGSRFFLIEALAARIADACLGEPVVHRVRVRVEKPGALRAARTVGVEIVRERESGTGDQDSPPGPPVSGPGGAP